MFSVDYHYFISVIALKVVCFLWLRDSMFEIIVNFWSVFVCVFLYEISLLRSSWSFLEFSFEIAMEWIWGSLWVLDRHGFSAMMVLVTIFFILGFHM